LTSTKLPNFFVVGAPKAGTTSLYHYLDQHPQIYTSPIKEPHYFATEVRQENCEPELRRQIARETRRLKEFLAGPMIERRFGRIVTDWEDYLRLFTNAENESALGEASVCYLWSQTAPDRIAETVPDAKILVMFRDPTERAWSQYLQGLGNGAIRWSLREHVRRNLQHHSKQFAVHYPFLEFGLYSEQFRRYLERFEPNVWFGLYEDFRRRPLETYRDICRFLGVADDFSPNMDRRHMEAQVPRVGLTSWLKRSGVWKFTAGITPSRLRPLIRRAVVRKPGATHIEPADRRYLTDFYREDVRKLAGLLNRNLDDWMGIN